MIKHAVIPERGKIIGASLTGSYQTILAPDDDLRAIFVFNSCNQPILLSLDGGITDHYELDGEGFDVDFRALGLALEKPTISARHMGQVPSSGSIRVTAIK